MGIADVNGRAGFHGACPVMNPRGVERVNWPTFEADGVRLINGDCLAVMPTLEPGSVDLILADLPYGTTACKWDTVIPFEPLWACYKRVLKPRGAVVLTASQPFTSMLVMSNREWFRFDDVWDKCLPTGFLDANRRPLRRHESVLLFAPAGSFTFNPEMRTGRLRKKGSPGPSECYGSHAKVESFNDQYYPTSIAAITNAHQSAKVHPTQKPVALFEYLIKTYSNEGELVLDNTIGSGTTAVACQNTGRRCIGIERDPTYFETAIKRVKSAQLPLLASDPV